MKFSVATTVLACLASLPAISYSQSFCYYWVANDGTITAYTSPPIDLSYPNLAYDTGRLMIGRTRYCENGAVIVEAETKPAAAPATVAPPTATAASTAPRPVAVEQVAEAPAEVNLAPAASSAPAEVNLAPAASSAPAEVNLRPREDRVFPAPE